MDVKLTPQITPEIGEKMSPQITATLQGYIGRGASGFEINEEGNLIVTMTDGQKIDLGRVKGDQGATIISIEQTAQSGDYTTYTITLSDGQTFDFEVKAAVGPPGKDGKDGYTPIKGVDYFDGQDGKDGYTPVKGKDYFDGQNGKDGKDGVSPTASVQQTATGAKIIITDSSGKTEATITNGTDGTDGEDAPEITDISINSDYHLIIKLSDGSSYDAGYCRGASGAGSGDMMSSTYDPQGKNRDIFKYVDDQMANVDFDVTADEVTFDDGETFQQKYDSGELRGQDGEDGYTPVKGKDYFDGQDGKDGNDGVGIKSVTQTTTSDADGGENVITVTKTDNTTSTFKVRNGSKGSTGEKGADGAAGSPGKDGSDGVGIQSVEQTTTSTADGGTNVITVTKTDGTTSTFSVKNGSKGADGADAVFPSITGLIKGDGAGGGTAAVAGTDYAAASHNQAASTITAGTFAGQVVANSGGETYSTFLLRNTRLASSDTTPSNNGEICWTYG